jgi:hypothetical protein
VEIPASFLGAPFACSGGNVERVKLGATASTPERTERLRQTEPQGPTYEMRIRPRTDGGAVDRSINERRNGGEAGAAEVDPDGTPEADGGAMAETREGAEQGPASRHIPSAVKREVWRRDRRQCAFVSADGRRCTERAYLELHHVQPYALDGPAP